MPSTWLMICSWICRTANMFLQKKILRASFKSDKRLFGEVSLLIFSLLSEFFSLAAGQELLGAMVVIYQSFGEFARFHPHWHVLVLEGGFTAHDRFVYLPLGACDGMLRIWQAAMLALFFFLWLAVLSWEDLSVALPMQALNYVLVAVLAKYLLHEDISPLRWAGIALVCVGVMLITKSSTADKKTASEQVQAAPIASRIGDV